MKLSYFLNAAEELAEIIWPIKEKLGIVDLILRGSVARRVPTPVDLDMVIIHNNPGLDVYQGLLRNKRFKSDREAFYNLKEHLKEIDLIKLLKGAKVDELISKELFHTSYMNISYFTDNNYRRKWNSENNFDFPQIIFNEGLLWNPSTKKYDIPALKKYTLPSKVKVS